MTDKVVLYIKGLHDMGEGECLEIAYAGNYCYKDGLHIIEYEEDFSDSVEDVNEKGETSKSTDQLIVSSRITISPREVQLLRQGSVGSHMVFTSGKKNSNYYDTPFGSMMMNVQTLDLDVIESEKEIKASIKYMIEFNDQPMGESFVEIRIVDAD